MERGRTVPIDAGDIAYAKVRETELPSGKGNHDLSRVVMTGQDQVKRALNLRGDPRKVAEEDAKARGLVRERLGPGPTRRVRLRIDTDQLNAQVAKLDIHAFVAEQPDPVERADRIRVDALREGIAAVGEIVVPEHDEARPGNGVRPRDTSRCDTSGGLTTRLSEEPLEKRHPRPARDQIAGDANKIRATFDNPGHRVLDRSPST